jgi:hypothetical protein
MTEINHARAMIARCEAKRDAATDSECRRYYELCIAGWQRWLEKVEQENAPGDEPGAFYLI